MSLLTALKITLYSVISGLIDQIYHVIFMVVIPIALDISHWSFKFKIFIIFSTT